MAEDERLRFPGTPVRLTRSEAARYVGASGESTIRAAEASGLACEQDEGGQSWHLPRALDEWKWRTKSPSPAQKNRVLRDAAKSRNREMKDIERRLALDLERQVAEWDAECARNEARRNAENDLRAAVRRQNEERRARFDLHYMAEATAGRALDLPSCEARHRLRDLVSRGLLRRFDSPNEVRVEWSYDGARAVETKWPICRGGPFFLRTEVLELRRDAAAAGRLVGREPNAPREMQSEDMFTTIMRLLAGHAHRRNGTPRSAV